MTWFAVFVRILAGKGGAWHFRLHSVEAASVNMRITSQRVFSVLSLLLLFEIPWKFLLF